MRIMHELNQLEMGGAERVVLGIIRHDRKNHHTVYTYKDGPMRQLFEAAGAEVVVEDGKEKRNLDVDVIHVHTGGDESTVAKCVKGAIPTVETVHSPVVTKVRDESVTIRVGVSGVVASMNRRCRRIYNGVDVSRLETPMEPSEAKQALGIPADARVIGRLGRVGTDKCLEEFLVACKIVQDGYAEADKPWVLVCGGEAKSSAGYLAKVKVMAASLPLKNVVFVPETDNVAAIYTAMDVFAYPSPTEGFGLVYLEAMVCGTPVVTWKTPLTEEILTGSAILADPTTRSLANSIKYVLQNEAVREELREAGYDLAVNHFGEKEMSEAYQAVYDEACPAPADWEKIRAQDPEKEQLAAV